MAKLASFGIASWRAKKTLYCAGNFFQFVFENLFRKFVDQLIDDDGENNVAMTTTPKRRKKRSKNSPKRSENDSKRLEKRSKTFRKLYIFGWAHCFGLFGNVPIHMGFDTLILHLSVAARNTNCQLPNGAKNPERPKNRKDSSDFDDFRTKSIALTRSKI